jgi:hypothetical protein
LSTRTALSDSRRSPHDARVRYDAEDDPPLGSIGRRSFSAGVGRLDHAMSFKIADLLDGGAGTRLGRRFGPPTSRRRRRYCCRARGRHNRHLGLPSPSGRGLLGLGNRQFPLAAVFGQRTGGDRSGRDHEDLANGGERRGCRWRNKGLSSFPIGIVTGLLTALKTKSVLTEFRLAGGPGSSLLLCWAIEDRVPRARGFETAT